MSKVGKQARPLKHATKVSTVGHKVKLMNLSTTPHFCVQTGRKLPFSGMAVEHDGKLFADFEAAEAYQCRK